MTTPPTMKLDKTIFKDFIFIIIGYFFAQQIDYKPKKEYIADINWQKLIN